jgi:hypothetical protein
MAGNLPSPQYGYVEEITYSANEGGNVRDRVGIRVLLVSGARVTITQESPLEFRTGDRIRIEQGRAFRE